MVGQSNYSQSFHPAKKVGLGSGATSFIDANSVYQADMRVVQPPSSSFECMFQQHAARTRQKPPKGASSDARSKRTSTEGLTPLALHSTQLEDNNADWNLPKDHHPKLVELPRTAQLFQKSQKSIPIVQGTSQNMPKAAGMEKFERLKGQQEIPTLRE